MKPYCPKCRKLSNVTIRPLREMYKVKGEDISVESSVAFCEECGQKVFFQEIDDKNLENAYSIYRKKHNLLSPYDIAEMRKKYSLSQRSLGRLLEWGEITINRYETGAIQDPAHNEVLTLVSDPINMKKIFEKNGYLLPERIRNALAKKIDKLIQGNAKYRHIALLEQFIAFHEHIDEYSGFRKFDVEKMINLILYIAERTKGVFETMLNKLLWYIDFVHFKKYAISLTGSVYKHLPHGPVPDNYKWIIAAAEEDGLNEQEKTFRSGISGILYTSSIHLEDSYFNEDEKEIIEFVLKYFKNYNSTRIRDKSHKEQGYKETEDGESISYRYASPLSIGLP